GYSGERQGPPRRRGRGVDIYVMLRYDRRRMRKTMVYLTEAQRTALARYARSRRKPVAQIIRDAVDRLLTSESRPRRRARSIVIASGPDQAPISEHTEELLRDYLRRQSS